MKLAFKLHLAIMVFAFFLFSCKKNNTITPPEFPFSEIATLGANDTVGTYIIKSDNAPFKIPIGISNISTKDRTLQISYSSPTAVQGEQYTAPTSIVIPAGTSVDSLEIAGIFNGFASVTRVDDLKITISGGDVSARGQKSNYLLKLKKYWVAPSDLFGGIYNIQDYTGGAPDGGPYQVEVSLLSANGPVLNMQVVGLWGMETPLKFSMNWIDLEHGTTVVPTQAWAPDLFGYGQSTVKVVGTGNFTVTPNFLTLSYNPTVSAGSFGSYISELSK